MRAGRLDRRITIQSKVVTQSESGAEVEAWTAIAHRLSSGYRPVSGDERFGGDQWSSSEQVEFTIRYSETVAGLSPLHRVIYPAPNVDTPTPERSAIYEVMAVHEIGRREGLKIMAARRSEVTA